MEITLNTTLDSLRDSELGYMFDRLLSCAESPCDFNSTLTIAQVHDCVPTWNAEDMLNGLHRAQELTRKGVKMLYPLYGEEEIARDPLLKQVCLIHMPAERRTHKTFVLILAGGGYHSVCTLSEGLPVAAYLNAQGYDCFCLNYRTKKDGYYADGLLPRPYDDIAAALRFIEANASGFALDINNYAIGGFSAGGHAVSMWGCENHGARHYGLPQPRVILDCYPVISMKYYIERTPDSMFGVMLGADCPEEKIAEYDPAQNVDSGYPPVYCVKAVDDDVVLYEDTIAFQDALNKAGVRNCFEFAPKGGHGFGNGGGTEFLGWTKRGLDFVGR